jgi:lysozyme
MNYLIDMIKQHEGLRLKPYHCTADKLTIGYGRNLEDRGITNDEAEYMLRNDIQLCYQELDCFSWFKDLDEPRQYALVDLCFNMGLPVLLKFRKALAAMGIEHCVDHIIPIAHPDVCGLHTFTNLQIITSEENRKKGQHFDPTEHEFIAEKS